MAILFYQIGIFIAIQIAASFGRNSRNTAIVLIAIFTVLQVFTSGLMFLQFITIILSYYFAKNTFENKKKNTQLITKPKTYQQTINEDKFFFTNLSDDFDIFGIGMCITEDNPILMKSEESANQYLEKLKSLKVGLNYKETENKITKEGYKAPIKEYEFYNKEKFIFFIYIYTKSDSDVRILPEYFKSLNSFIE